MPAVMFGEARRVRNKFSRLGDMAVRLLREISESMQTVLGNSIQVGDDRLENIFRIQEDNLFARSFISFNASSQQLLKMRSTRFMVVSILQFRGVRVHWIFRQAFWKTKSES